jgi:hypothetical protein
MALLAHDAKLILFHADQSGVWLKMRVGGKQNAPWRNKGHYLTFNHSLQQNFSEKNPASKS